MYETQCTTPLDWNEKRINPRAKLQKFGFSSTSRGGGVDRRRRAWNLPRGARGLAGGGRGERGWSGEPYPLPRFDGGALRSAGDGEQRRQKSSEVMRLGGGVSSA